MKFFTGLVVLSGVVAVFAAEPTTTPILADLQQLKATVASFNDKINALSIVNFASAYAVHTEGRNVITLLDVITRDTQALAGNPITQADMTSIFTALQEIQPLVNTAMTSLIAKRIILLAFQGLGFMQIARKDLADLKTSMLALEAAATTVVIPDAVKPELQAFFDAINKVMDAVIAAYAV
ncbi:hypothetical protein CVT24_012348 [Panaeolus cyanescens]|uniref:Uncharacterized protein n=1 Tax=Panaeolus cyanescens TaxID=181874 RepID=A0A409W6B6_9AGAR|nr:hypothetical protein CVT24_012348 [Panaeolus cyanescens]